MMKVYTGEELEKYKSDVLGIKEDLNEGYLAGTVREYCKYRIPVMLDVISLTGKGTKTGVLQGMSGLDAVYILSEQEENETAGDYISCLDSTDKQYIFIIEFQRIRENSRLLEYLSEEVRKGRRVIVSGSQSLPLLSLKDSEYSESIRLVYNTLSSYSEFLKIRGTTHDYDNIVRFFLTGGIMGRNAVRTGSVTDYIEKAFVDNLYAFYRGNIEKSRVRELVYSALYKVVRPENNRGLMPPLGNPQLSRNDFFLKMGVDIESELKESEIDEAADLFEKAGFIGRIANYDRTGSVRTQYYLCDPVIFRELLSNAYGVMEMNYALRNQTFVNTVAMTLLSSCTTFDNIYFLYGRESLNPYFIITDSRKEEMFTLFEVNPFKTKDDEPADFLISNDTEDLLCGDIIGRYLIYSGGQQVKEYPSGPVIFTPPDRTIEDYFCFEKNLERIKK